MPTLSKYLILIPSHQDINHHAHDHEHCPQINDWQSLESTLKRELELGTQPAENGNMSQQSIPKHQ